MSDTIRPPARAYFAWVDAEESLDYEHAACPRLEAPAALAFVDPRDGQTIVVWADRPSCVTWEMELSGARERRSPIGAS